MKISSRILIGVIIVLLGGVISSNIILKKQYNSLDRTDIYWTYSKILEKPFSHLHITGGNDTKIIYEPSKKPSLRLLREWVENHQGEVKADVRNDTLFINFDYTPPNLFEKFWMRGTTTVRIFAPELLSVTGENTNFEMQKTKQSNFTAHITGKSRFEVETLVKELDSVNVFQSDSSEVVFEVSPEYALNNYHDKTRIGFQATVEEQTNRNESLFIKSVAADVNNFSLLDIGHAQVKFLKLHVSDSAAIILSGGALRNRNIGSLSKH